MYIDAPSRSEPLVVPRALGVAIAVCAFGVVAIGVYPGPWTDAVMRVAATLF
jgi:NADH:ubiquinone oxidoreductase subunit 2 (subunit N)